MKILLLSLVLLAGCAPASVRTRVVQSANAASEIGADAEKMIAGLYRTEQMRCLTAIDKDTESKCIDQVQARYDPIWDAYRSYRLTWLAVAAGVHAYDTAVALGQKPDPQALLNLALQLTQAAAFLQAAVAAIHKEPVAAKLGAMLLLDIRNMLGEYAL